MKQFVFSLFLHEATKQTLQTRETKNIKYHLGNVLTVITDEKRMILDGNNYSHYESVVVSVTDYSPFGVSLTGRTFTTTEGYRYGFNGKESDPEHNTGAYDFGARIMDARLGRWMSVDPHVSQYQALSPYHFAFNSPLIFVDFDGKDGRLTIDYSTNQVTIETTIYLHGNLSDEEMRILAKDYNDKFALMDNTAIVNDPNDPSKTWTVTMKVNFVFDEVIDQALENLGASNSIQSSDFENIPDEIKQQRGMLEGDNIMLIGTIPGQSEGHLGFTAIGRNEGVSNPSFHTTIHETGHMLGMDERYYPGGHTVYCEVGDFNMANDIMSNNQLGNEIGAFHFADMLDYALEISEGFSGEYYVGSCLDPSPTEMIEKEDGSFEQKIVGKPYIHTFQIDDTNRGRNSCNDQTEVQSKRVKK